MSQRPEVAFSGLVTFSMQVPTALVVVAFREWIKHVDAIAPYAGVRTHRWARANELNRIGPSKA